MKKSIDKMQSITSYVTEPSREVPIVNAYDVIVVGGGIAGCAAALAAARAGANVALLEKTCSLGGLATLANVNIYLPLCDGLGNQVIKGLGEELLALSIRDGYNNIPPCWQPGGEKAERSQHRYRVNFYPASLLLDLEELLLKEGVTIWYDTKLCDVYKEANRIKALLIENKSGRTALQAGVVIDSSGDADVCAQAGEETVSLNTNTASSWFFHSGGPRPVSICKSHVLFASDGGPPPNGERGYAGDNARDVTEHILDSREIIRNQLKKLAETKNKSVRPILVPTIPAFRMTRRLKGAIELEETDDGKMFPDTIGMTGDWRKAGPVYNIPLRSLIGTRTDNLITAGRCISAASAWDITRAIPTCVVTGQGAGVAAALFSHSTSARLADINIAELQNALRKQDVWIPESAIR